MSVCVIETWTLRGPRPEWGCCVTNKKIEKKSVPTVSETHYLSCSEGVVGSVLGVKWPGRDTGHSIRTEIRNSAQVRGTYMYDGQQVVTVCTVSTLQVVQPVTQYTYLARRLALLKRPYRFTVNMKISFM